MEIDFEKEPLEDYSDAREVFSKGSLLDERIPVEDVFGKKNLSNERSLNSDLDANDYSDNMDYNYNIGYDFMNNGKRD